MLPGLCGASVRHGLSIQHPFLLCEVAITDATGIGIDAREQLPVNGKRLIRCKAKGTLGQRHI